MLPSGTRHCQANEILRGAVAGYLTVVELAQSGPALEEPFTHGLTEVQVAWIELVKPVVITVAPGFSQVDRAICRRRALPLEWKRYRSHEHIRTPRKQRAGHLGEYANGRVGGREWLSRSLEWIFLGPALPRLERVILGYLGCRQESPVAGEKR